MFKIFIYPIITFFISTSLIDSAKAYFENAEKTKNKAEMNGLSFEQFKDFTSKWKLVTVRYRVDSKELRFIYANTKAWDGLKKLKPNYENGAAFGKVAFLAEPDPSFTSSLSPSGVKRFQIMLKDSKKYKETDGWGYALFNEEGGLFNEDMKVKTMACAACHRIVPERDYIFARQMNLEIGKSNVNDFDTKQVNQKINFQLQKNRILSMVFKEHLINKNQDFYFIEGDIKTNAFSGTLDEIIPFLIEKTKATGIGSALYLSNTHFSFVEKSNTPCTNMNEIKYHVVVQFNNSLVRNNELCQ